MREIWSAPAKINLSLTITACRPDGYHIVDTVYQAINLADTVILEPQTGDADVTCVVTGPMAGGVPAGEDNLVARAAHVLAERTGHRVRVAITIDKRIPRGAGLGGGSSDAAAVLMALGKRYAVPDPEHTLNELASEIGADVPFFLRGGTQRGRGIGERLEAVDPPAERWGLLAWPGVRVSTAWAFSRYDASPTSADEANVFEPIVFAEHPEVEHAFAVLSDGPASVVRMTGTGGAVFGLYASERARDADRDRVTSALPDPDTSEVWAFRCIDLGVDQVSSHGSETSAA